MCKVQEFLTMLMNEVHECDLPSILYQDNEVAVYFERNQHVSARPKQIGIRKHYVREHLIELGEMEPIKSKNNFVDVFTKNVEVSTFEYLRKTI